MVGNPAKTVTIVGTGKSIDFYIFVKVGYYPLLPLACTSIEASLKLMHWLLLCVVYGYTLTWLEYNLIKLFFYFYFLTLRIPMFNHMVYSTILLYNAILP